MKAIYFRLPYEVNSCERFPPELVFTPFHYCAKLILFPHGLSNAISLSPLMKIKDGLIGPYEEGVKINGFRWFKAGEPPRGLLLLYDEEKIRPDYVLLGFHMDWEGAISQIDFWPKTKEQLTYSGFFGSEFADFLVVTSWKEKDKKGAEKYRVEFKGGTNKIIQKILSNIPYNATIVEISQVNDYFVPYFLYNFTAGIIFDKEGIMYEACIPLDLLYSFRV